MAIKSGHSFPSSFGFTGSAGQQNVRGYARGGRVKGDATFDNKRGTGESVAPRGAKPGGPTFDNKRGTGESIKPSVKSHGSMPSAASQSPAPVSAKQPRRQAPKGALGSGGPLMPGYKKGGKTTPQPFKRGGREC